MEWVEAHLECEGMKLYYNQCISKLQSRQGFMASRIVTMHVLPRYCFHERHITLDLYCLLSQSLQLLQSF